MALVVRRRIGFGRRIGRRIALFGRGGRGRWFRFDQRALVAASAERQSRNTRHHRKHQSLGHGHTTVGKFRQV